MDQHRRTIIDDGTSQCIATVAGGGILINSVWSVAHDIHAGRLVRILPRWEPAGASVLWLIYPRSNVLTPKVRCFMDFILWARLPDRWLPCPEGKA